MSARITTDDAKVRELYDKLSAPGSGWQRQSKVIDTNAEGMYSPSKQFFVSVELFSNKNDDSKSDFLVLTTKVGDTYSTTVAEYTPAMARKASGDFLVLGPCVTQLAYQLNRIFIPDTNTRQKTIDQQVRQLDDLLDDGKINGSVSGRPSDEFSGPVSSPVDSPVDSSVVSSDEVSSDGTGDTDGDTPASDEASYSPSPAESEQSPDDASLHNLDDHQLDDTASL